MFSIVHLADLMLDLKHIENRRNAEGPEKASGGGRDEKKQQRHLDTSREIHKVSKRRSKQT